MTKGSTFKRPRNKAKAFIAPLVLSVALLSLSACSGSVTVGNGNETSPTTSNTSPSALPSTTTTSSPQTLAETVINGLPTKSEIAVDANGEYIQTTVSDTDPAMKYNASVVSPEAKATYNEEDILSAQKFIVKFIAEEGLDSVMNGTKENPAIAEKWWANVKDTVDPALQAEFFQKVTSNDNYYMPVYRYTGKQSTLISGEDKTHVNSRKMTVSSVNAALMEGKQYIGFQVQTETVYNVIFKGQPSPSVNASNGTFNYTLVKDEASGKWLIAGYKNTFNDSAA